MSKQFTAAAVLVLQQDSRLRVSDPVAKYLPQFAKPGFDKIQIHHLLSHTSGLPTTDDESAVAHGLELVRLGDESESPVYRDGQHGRVYSSGFGSGGVYASANDLMRWHHVLNGDDLLTDESKQKLFQPNLSHYAYGWIVKDSGLDGKRYQMHSGSNEGYFSRMMRVPDDDLVIIAVGNMNSTDALDDAVEQFFRFARGINYRLPLSR